MVPNSFSLMKKIAKFNNTEKKLSCIIGDFNNLKFKDESLDFIMNLMQFITLMISIAHLKK